MSWALNIGTEVVLRKLEVISASSITTWLYFPESALLPVLAQRTNPFLFPKACPLPVTLTPFLPPLMSLFHYCFPHFLNFQSLFFLLLFTLETYSDLSYPENTTKRNLSQSNILLDLPILPSNLNLKELGYLCPLLPTPHTPTPCYPELCCRN